MHNRFQAQLLQMFWFCASHRYEVPILNTDEPYLIYLIADNELYLIYVSSINLLQTICFPILTHTYAIVHKSFYTVFYALAFYYAYGSFVKL